MQRWIAAALVAMVLMFGGGWYAYRCYMANRPHPVWFILQIGSGEEISARDKAIKELKTKISNPEILAKVSHDLGLTKKWQLATDELCARELEQRLFVRAGDKDTPMGKVPAIHVGVNGKEKESALTEKIAYRLMDDVARIIGIKMAPNTGK